MHYALVIGAGHGIGCALVQKLLVDCPHLKIFASYRLEAMSNELQMLSKIYSDRLEIIPLDPTNETQLQKLSTSLMKKNIELNLVINSVGVLHDEKLSPEKSLRSFDPVAFLEVIRVNSLVTPLMAKHFEKNLNKTTNSGFVALSAKVGSIGDNQLGGWYSYRASKAALNMLIKNISIEFKRSKNKCVVLAIHPGTTETQLSSPFIASTNYKIHSPIETASNILSVINQRDLTHTGMFLNWDGMEIKW